jgi:hypothetical protein
MRETRAETKDLIRLLKEFKATLAESGMASMDEYGDMLKWGLPTKNGNCRYFHVFHPDFCSWSDQFYGTIHFHGGEIRGTVLLGNLEHSTYEATETEDGDRFHDGKAYALKPNVRQQAAGTSYSLPAHVPHWLKPSELTLTYFEEEDNGVMGDLLNPSSDITDDHVWEQADAEAIVPQLLALIDARLNELSITAQEPPQRMRASTPS